MRKRTKKRLQSCRFILRKTFARLKRITLLGKLISEPENMKKIIFLSLSLFTLLFFTQIDASETTQDTTLAGTVYDHHGAVIIGATVNLVDEKGKFYQSLTKEGGYQFNVPA